MRIRQTRRRRLAGLAIGLALAATQFAAGQYVTGHWNFDDPNNWLGATVGADGYYWTRPQDPNELPIGYPDAITEFGLASEFGVPFPSGDGGVMSFDSYNYLEGIDLYPEAAPNGGGSYVNQYTIIFDVYYPADSSDRWRAFLQTNVCNENDSDFFVNTDNGIGISGQYDGTILPDTWHRVAFSVDLANIEFGGTEENSGFGLASEYGIEMGTDDGGILMFGQYSPIEALDMYHGIAANGGGSYVNEYTLIYDVYYPSTSTNSYISFINTQECNENDQDLAGHKSGDNNYWAIGISGNYAGQVVQDQWHRVIFAVDLPNDTLYRYIDGVDVGSMTLDGSVDGRWSLYTADDGIPALLLGDNDGDTDAGYLASMQVRNYVIDSSHAATLGGVDLSDNIPATIENGAPSGAAVTGQWNFEDPSDGLAATLGIDLEWFDGSRCDPNGTSAPIVGKYIDGVLVAEQFLGEGVDERWSIEPQSSNLPCIIFTDENGEVAPGYCGSIQFRDYAMSEAELGTLGGVDAGNIPAGTGVTGQWDFDDPDDGLAATSGRDLEWFTDERCQEPFEPGDPQSKTEFDLASTLGVPLPDGDGGVMHFQPYSSIEALELYHAIDANGGGDAVNEYTLIFDLHFPEIDDWTVLFQTEDCNLNDGDFWVRYDGAIGVSGEYDGELLPSTWHRVAIVVDQSPSVNQIYKYIDGVYVGAQDADGVDGRWALWPAEYERPMLLLTDDDDEAALEGYCSSIQIRDYAMKEAELEVMGGVTYDNVPGGSGVVGQWDFENSADGLAATTGNDLVWYDGTRCLECTQDLAETTEFGDAALFGAWDLPDGPANAMYFDATIPCTGYLFPHGAEANGGGTKVNEYTIIMDLFIPVWDYFGPPLGHDPSWIALYQTWSENNGDAMLWIRTQDGALGDDGEYEDTAGWIYEDEWVRVVAAVDCTTSTVTKCVIYEDDSVAGPITQLGDGLDGKRAMWTDESAIEENFLLLFADENFETHRGICSSLQVRDYVMNEAEIIALGGPRAAGIPIPPCAGDIDGDGDTDLSDLAELLGAYGSTPEDPNWNADADLDVDGDVDLSDLAALLGDYGCGV